jgi:hypothetical protein
VHAPGARLACAVAVVGGLDAVGLARSDVMATTTILAPEGPGGPGLVTRITPWSRRIRAPVTKSVIVQPC